jgi:hypothetical protein
MNYHEFPTWYKYAREIVSYLLAILILYATSQVIGIDMEGFNNAVWFLGGMTTQSIITVFKGREP